MKEQALTKTSSAHGIGKSLSPGRSADELSGQLIVDKTMSHNRRGLYAPRSTIYRLNWRARQSMRHSPEGYIVAQTMQRHVFPDSRSVGRFME